MSFVDIMEDDPNVDTTMKSIHNFQEHSWIKRLWSHLIRLFKSHYN